MADRQRMILPPLFISVGSALTVFFRQRDDLNPILRLAPWWYTAALWVGAAFIAVGIGLLVISPLWRGLKSLWRLVIDRLVEPPRYKCRATRDSELERLLTYWSGFFPGQMPQLAQVQAWHRKNNKMFWFLLEVRDRGGKRRKEHRLVGSFSVLPLSKKAAAQVANEELIGSAFSADHLVKRNGSCAAVYIGGVVASDWRARGEILARVSERIEHYQEKGTPVFTRPITPDGLRLVDKYDFAPVVEGKHGMHHVYALNAHSDT